MSVDRSLRVKSSLERHRNVLTRAERISALTTADRFSEGASPLGLPKVAHRKAQTGKKKAKKAEETPEGAKG